MSEKKFFLSEDRKKKLLLIFCVTFSIALLMTVYECLKHFFFPQINIVQSHIITVIFVTILGFFATTCVVYRISRMTAKAVRRSEEVRKMEKAIIDLQEKLDFIIENAIESLVLFDVDTGKLKDFNTNSYLSLGYSREEFESLDLEAFHKIFEKIDLSMLAKHPEKIKKPLHVDTTIIDKDSTLKHISATIAFIDMSNNRYLLVAWKETTQTKKFEKILADNTVLFERLLETLPMPVFYKNSHRHYLGCNKAFEEFFGISRHEILGKTVLDIGICQETAEKLNQKDMELLHHRGRQVYEGHLSCRKKGMRKVVFHKSTFDDADGNLAGILGIIIDLTELTKT
ncbi:MAG: PAS domain S-box protein [Candidatus Nanoarchaeia archaeon]